MPLVCRIFPLLGPGVDVSVSVDLLEKYTALLKVTDSDLKPLEYIANELQTRSKELRSHANAVGTAVMNKKNG